MTFFFPDGWFITLGKEAYNINFTTENAHIYINNRKREEGMLHHILSQEHRACESISIS